MEAGTSTRMVMGTGRLVTQPVGLEPLETDQLQETGIEHTHN